MFNLGGSVNILVKREKSDRLQTIFQIKVLNKKIHLVFPSVFITRFHFIFLVFPKNSFYYLTSGLLRVLNKAIIIIFELNEIVKFYNLSECWHIMYGLHFLWRQLSFIIVVGVGIHLSYEIMVVPWTIRISLADISIFCALTGYDNNRVTSPEWWSECLCMMALCYPDYRVSSHPIYPYIHTYINTLDQTKDPKECVTLC